MENFLNKKNQNLLETNIVEMEGRKISLKKFKARKEKKKKSARSTTITCPNCLSRLVLNKLGLWECTGDKLEVWKEDFIKFSSMEEKQKGEYLVKLSNYSRFIELFDKWKYSIEVAAPEEFNCGYTNVVFPITGSASVRIPDPLIVKRLEKKLGRKLTEEELIGESELYSYSGRVLTEWRKKAKVIKIPYIILPSEVTVYYV
jgi:hypothetical protein